MVEKDSWVNQEPHDRIILWMDLNKYAKYICILLFKKQ